MKTIIEWIRISAGTIRCALQNAILNNRRRFKRYACEFPVEFHFDYPGQIRIITAMARNISSGGMLIECPSLPSSNTPCHVVFNVPDWMPCKQARHEVTASAQVLHAEPSSLTFGIMFKEPL